MAESSWATRELELVGADAGLSFGIAGGVDGDGYLQNKRRYLVCFIMNLQEKKNRGDGGEEQLTAMVD